VQRCIGVPSWDEIIPLLVGFDRIISLKVFLPERSLNIISAQTWLALSKNFSRVVSLSFIQFNTTDASALAQLFCAFPHLRKIYISGIVSTDIFESEQPSATTFRPPLDLHSFETRVFGMRAVLEWFLSLSARPALRTVRLYQIEYGDLAMVNKFIGAFGSGLESLSLSTFVEDCMLPHLIR
jgi:hypothetical protein